MTTQHTPEPWRVAEESFDNGGIQESVIRGLDGRAAIAVTLEFGPNNPGMREANARRIVACVNACAGIDTDFLERTHSKGHASGIGKHLALEKQRDELLVAAQNVVDRWDTPLWKDVAPTADFIAALRKAIAKAKGGAV